MRFPKVEFEFFGHSPRVPPGELGRVANNHVGRSTRIGFCGVGEPMELQHDRTRTQGDNRFGECVEIVSFAMC